MELNDKIWNCRVNTETPMPNKIRHFLEKVHQLSLKYQLSISHEDGHGAFKIEDYNENNIIWLSNAHDNTSKENQ